MAHGDYLQQRIAAARQLNRYVTSDDLQSYVSDFIDEHCQGAQLVRVRDGEPALWELDLGPAVRAGFSEFLEKERLQGKTRLATAASGRQPCVFENVLKRSRTDAESISQYHPLIAYVRRRLEADERHRHAVVSALRIPSAAIGNVAGGAHVFAVHRWSISGEQDSERLAFEVIRLDDQQQLSADDAERLVTVAAMQGQPWPAARGQLDGNAVGDCFEAVTDVLDRRYQEFTESAGRENRDRVSFQLDQVDRQEAREIQRLQQIIWRLRVQNKMRTIKANEGRVSKVRERAAERRARLQNRRELTHDSMLVCAGVVLVD